MRAFAGSPQAWNELIAGLPMPHLLQTWEWSQVKANFGWQGMPFVWQSAAGKPVAAAMLLKRTIAVGGFAARMNVLYVPKGPNLDWGDADLREQVLADLLHFAQRQGSIFIKIDPDVSLGTGVPGTAEAAENPLGKAVQSGWERSGWRFSPEQIQFRNTVLVDLTAPEETLLARMKQKSRYNLRLAQRKGVRVRAGRQADLAVLYKMYAETSVRDGFLIRGEEYYQHVWKTFGAVPAAPSPGLAFHEPLIAEVDGEPVAAISVFYFGSQAVYLFGMSRQAHREKMPNYLLQWEAMRRAKALGCSSYNLWGAPTQFNEQDSLWGVFRFKEGLGGMVLRTPGAWDYPVNPLTYRLYTTTLPRLMDILRSRGKARTKQSLGA